MFVTLEVSHALMSSSKVAAAALQSPTALDAQNRNPMCVTPPVPHVAMWP